MGLDCCNSCLVQEEIYEIPYNNNKKNEILSYINENYEINKNDNLSNKDNTKLFLKENIIDKKKLYGFYNPQNDCFMNASLQIFTHIDELNKFIKSFCENNNMKNNPLIVELYNIIKNIEEGKDNKIINGKLVKEEIGKLDERFKTNDQQDASEFISFFIGKLLEETQGTKKNINSLEEELKELNELEKEGFSRLYKRFFLKKGKSYIVDLFYGILKVETRDIKDDNLISVSFNMFNILELPIYYLVKNKIDDSLSLENILISFFKDKKINEDGKTYAINSLMRLPKYLIIFFNRSVDEDYLDINITYNKNIDMKNYLSLRKNINIKNNIYSLVSVIEHTGNAKFGHYTALCKISEQNWYRFSDSSYTLNLNQYKSSDAIMLIYKNLSQN